ncbi:hypothetical protein HME9302_01349 [Alteripontixanthobacter maritimus]|uniref:DUF2855 family protein n=1 Tax=Alteripontixanthobacter maritimus TaxID=2161824 RepID=A0A369Q6W9_9SPHN|nr:DUF2855 family protein [Alteripontixanthobacter maritimus]RDC60150.1 hypothetical protein HME9302_01349 [Alteripontixanthobacter maritimus]
MPQTASEAVYVDKADLTQAETDEVSQNALAADAIRLAIESFSITANNITYAVVGDGFGYWNFFPASADKGIVPVWGHAQVIETNHPQFATGERVYGYLPMGTHLDVLPGKVSESGFVDIAEHRQPMSPIYNQYSRLAADPEHDPSREAERMLFGPLFKTGFLIESFMRREGWFGADAVLMTSASSKTALGCASVAKHRSPETKRIGLTSTGNVDFVRGTGLYDEVLPYEAIAELQQRPSVVVDFAGNAKLLADIHTTLGDALKYSCLVGATHIDERGSGLGGATDLPGPKPVLFFAPDHAVAAIKQSGSAAFGQDIAQSWHAFLQDAAGTVEIERHRGIAEAREAYQAMVAGTVDPAKGIIIEL